MRAFTSSASAARSALRVLYAAIPGFEIAPEPFGEIRTDVGAEAKPMHGDDPTGLAVTKVRREFARECHCDGLRRFDFNDAAAGDGLAAFQDGRGTHGHGKQVHGVQDVLRHRPAAMQGTPRGFDLEAGKRTAVDTAHALTDPRMDSLGDRRCFGGCAP